MIACGSPGLQHWRRIDGARWVDGGAEEPMMNWYHRRRCRSEEWARKVAEFIVPGTIGDADLGPEVLEIGPGYGATTVPLAQRYHRLTALEIDPILAARLRRQLPPGNGVWVVHGDGAHMPFADGRFTGAFCATMLHHVPSAKDQDRVFAEACRVLGPSGVFVGSDSLPSVRFRLIHIGDTMVPVDPGTLETRLRRAGFADVTVVDQGQRVQFLARK
jgi:SAM-dependent methyltransferase